ncbi:hypothetical protein LOC67_12660 [Stieleria sp. JC731]|uniref:hypothetical protein n=1 Tax=Pirellulaceae TaxID=2691357 RepID=UPI001E2E42ED|nr:hypothetical protein [Stieleria sp. JC731]MCC9601399.1 hypothetical protein [Stieleria sp. JC731]
MIYDPYQSRKLTGPHAELYARSLGVMLDVFRDCFAHPDDDQHWQFGVHLFDSLDWSTKLTLLLKVSRFALLGKGDAHDWGALEKAACFSVYQHVYQQLEIESDLIDLENRSRCAPIWPESGNQESLDQTECCAEILKWKQLIREAYREDAVRDGADDDEIQYMLAEEDDDELRYYFSIIDVLANRLVDDRDFELAPSFMDVDPEIGFIVKESLGISGDYFIQASDATSIEVALQTFDQLADLAGTSRLQTDFPPY